MSANAGVVERVNPHPYYRISALAKGFLRMFRAFLPLVIVIVVNALIQGLLTLGNPTPVLSSGRFVVGALVSLVALWVTMAWITAAGLAAAKGRAHFSEIRRELQGKYWRYIAWTAVVGILAMIGWMLFEIPGLIVLALTPFVAFATLDAEANPFVVNFRVIGRRFIRWLITVIIVGLLSVVLLLLSAVNTFFVGDAFGAFFAWLILGIIFAWWFSAFALIYCSAMNPVPPAGASTGAAVDAGGEVA
ncbi:MAG: hypothetical protein Q8P61_02865 [Candidatus Nanopelagicales bacterium]|nr:hypothetical protein [Candidatus Nanopelagicales bacterium]